ncbi:MAG TPA: hypothetical protein VGN80_10450 [Devosiaceae bacterium]|jgi:ElaB/YqjD/DUF883 family membrane-anchored ribosome-binding protein|nr:hypothetical protein [Devosiaceae bacterium]
MAAADTNRDTPDSNSRKAQAAAKQAATSSVASEVRGRELEVQIEQLQADLKSIAATLAGLAGDKVNEARGVAEKEARNLARTGQHAVDEVQDELGQLERRLKDSIREKPLTAVIGAAALGYILAVVTR